MSADLKILKNGQLVDFGVITRKVEIPRETKHECLHDLQTKDACFYAALVTLENGTSYICLVGNGWHEELGFPISYPDMHYPLFRGKTKAKLREVFKEDRLFDFSEVYSGDLNDLVYVECPPREPRSPDAWEYEDISMIMDSLLEAKVYTGKDEETVRHMDAYNTVTNFKRLDAWWEQHRGDYSPKAWLEMAAEWKGNPNSFNRRILGYIIEDKLQAQPA